MRMVNGVPVWGDPDERTLSQLMRCKDHPSATAAALMADAHVGYSMPIGGVVAYDGMVSPSGVGYDIACGIMAAETEIQAEDLQGSIGRILDDIQRAIPFGVGEENPNRVDHPLFDDPLWKEDKNIGRLKPLAQAQLGTTGAGNHFVDILRDLESNRVWVAAHFGSRGFGHSTATGFLNLANKRPFSARPPRESMDQPPTLIPVKSELGQSYIAAMKLAGRYAYAGREHVVATVLDILGVEPTKIVHNHHNFAWLEEHKGRKVWVVRKGATPAFPGQEGFVGGSMGDIAAVVAGIDTEANRKALRSTIHGAGRVMSRMEARGRRRRGRVIREPAITREMMHRVLKRHNITVRGGDVDEAPQAYRPLQEVLDAHKDSVEVRHTFRPMGVVMAGRGGFDP